MADPTFAHHFGIAVQSDILRQAATDQRRRQAQPATCDDAREEPIRRRPRSARLAAALRAYLRHGRAQTAEESRAWSEQRTSPT